MNTDFIKIYEKLDTLNEETVSDIKKEKAHL